MHAADLKAALLTQELISGTHKILPLSALQARLAQWRQQGLKIGFTNGCFDLVHPGHVSLLEKARARCDRLVVAINSDASVRRLKGESRPVQHEMSRAVVLASLSAVDAVTIFEEDTPQALIEALRPNVLIKGADYRKDQVVGGAFVESYGGEIYLAPIAEGNSTTGIIKKLMQG